VTLERRPSDENKDAEEDDSIELSSSLMDEDDLENES